MQKPSNYDSVQAAVTGEYETLEPGGYICRIIKADVAKSQKGGEMLVLSFDIAEGGKKDFYARRFKADDRPGKKWQGVYRQLTGGESTKFFKAMITAIEESNAGYKFDFDERKLTGKLFGGIFGRREWFNISRGEYQFITELFWVRSIEKIRNGDFKTPADKLVGRNTGPDVPPPGFVEAEMTVDDDDLPF